MMHQSENNAGETGIPIANDKRKRKVFILGLDGATFDIIKPLMDKGELPNIAHIMKSGAHAELNSTVLPHSPSAWTSFSTGKNPGKHGIIGFRKMMRNTYKLDLVTGQDNKAKTLWEILSEKEKKVIVMNIPMTYPPKPVNGILISGMDAPSTDSNFTYPREIREELLKVVPDYKIRVYLGGYLTNNRKRIKALHLLKSTIHARTKAVLHLMKNHPWDLFVVRYNNPDNVQHQYWNFMDETHPSHEAKAPKILKDGIESIYRELDKAVGIIYSNIDKENTTFIIMSDHGGMKLIGSIYVNEWLRSMGYLYKTGEENRLNFNNLFRNLVISLKGKTFSLLLKHIPLGVKLYIKQLFPFIDLKPYTHYRFARIDWSRTKAFTGEVESIRINLKGKYPCGTVEEKEYIALREEIVDAAKKLKDPISGEQVFKKVFKKEEVFSPDWMEDFPDIILQPREYYTISAEFRSRGNGSFIGKNEHWRRISGGHGQYGIFIITGPDCKSGIKLNPLEIVDILPTVLYQFNLPLHRNVDGRVVKDVFKKEFANLHPVIYEDVKEYDKHKIDEIYNEDEKSKIAAGLRDLGYIE